MALRRGFKTEANATASEIRAELKLHSIAPLNPWELANHLEIPVMTLSSFGPTIPTAVAYFLEKDTKAFSAMTVFDGTRRAIVYNDSHSKSRQASDISHEISHGVLLHTPRQVFDGSGCRDWNEDEEDEANWLAGVLLITEAAAISVVRRGLTIEQAAAEYCVSTQMMRWRINATGAHTRVNRTRNYRRGNRF